MNIASLAFSIFALVGIYYDQHEIITVSVLCSALLIILSVAIDIIDK